MLENNKEKVISLIKSNLNIFSFFEKVYLFGSLLYDDRVANDIDILLVYKIFHRSQIEEKIRVINFLESRTNVPVDLTILSFDEMNEMNFLKRIKKYIELK